MAKKLDINKVKQATKEIETQIDMAKVRKALEKDELKKAQLEKSIAEKKKILAKGELVKK
jgi:hypothetical protein